MALTKAHQQFLDRAIEPAQVSERDTQVPASITLAQAILESGWGTTPISDANNYFGIKAVDHGDGPFDVGPIASGHILAETEEFEHGHSVTIVAAFRKYATMADSFRDHGHFL